MSEDEVVAGMIAATLENAARAPYYARAWGDAWRDVRTVSDLVRLPLLDKATAIAHQKELIVGERPPGFGIASSGTTRTADLPALNVLRTDGELAAIRGDAEEGAPDPDDEHPGWTLVAVGVHHGLPRGAPRSDELLVPWSYHKNALSMIDTVLGDPQPDGRRVTAMRISAGALKTFTAWALENGRDPRAYGVKLVGTNGSRVSLWWRTRIEALFDCTLYDNFSLSEIPTVATECKACGGLHFGWPPLLYEVLDLLTGEPVVEGTGRLVVTPLFPWVATMPLVRYDTGDVVEVAGLCAAVGAPIVHYLGRARRGVVVDDEGRGAFVLAPAHVQDVLEASERTQRNPHPAVTNGLVRSAELGLPRWTVERIDDATGEAPTVRLAFEVRFDPLLFSREARALEADVVDRLLAADLAARRLLDDGRIRLEVVAATPGTLQPPGDKFE